MFSFNSGFISLLFMFFKISFQTLQNFIKDIFRVKYQTNVMTIQKNIMKSSIIPYSYSG